MVIHSKWLERLRYMFNYPKDFVRLGIAILENYAIEVSEMIVNHKKVKCQICGWEGNAFRNFLERHFIIARQQCPVCSSLRRNSGLIDYLLKLPMPDGRLRVVET